MIGILSGLSLVLTLLGAGGCVVYERVAVRPHCAEAVWVEGHDGPNGYWHPAHWRCIAYVDEGLTGRPDRAIGSGELQGTWSQT